MNGANGMSDIEGKAATGSGERGGSRASFNTDKSNGSGINEETNLALSKTSSESVTSAQSAVLPNSKKVYVPGSLHSHLRVPFREISLAPTKTISGQIEVNEPVRVYDTSGPWGDETVATTLNVEAGPPALPPAWIRGRGAV